MAWLLRKDGPWVIGGGIVATLALGGALHEHSGARVFVVGADRLEGAFHTAWITGVVLGSVAACFDEVLGTREFLAQRPLARTALIRARLRALLIVLACSFVLGPIGAWIGFAAFHDGMWHTRLAALPAIYAAYVVALSGAGIGVAAGSLPVPWWQRIVVAAAWFGASFALIDAVSRGYQGAARMAPFVFAHVGAAAVFFAIAAVAARYDADPDRPRAQVLRAIAGVPAAAALAVLWTVPCGEGQARAIDLLQDAYPVVLKRGDEHVLVRATHEPGVWRVCDRDHRSTGERIDGRQPGRGGVRRPMPSWHWLSFGFDAPLWHSGHQSGWSDTTTVLLAADGLVWTRSLADGLRATGRGAELLPFANDSLIGDVGDSVVVIDGATRQPWRYDDAAGHFVPMPLPAGERGEQLGWASLDDKDPDDAALLAQLADPKRAWAWQRRFVRTQHGAYTVRDGALVAVPGLLARVDRGRWARDDALATNQTDPIVIPIELPDDGSPVRFRHELRPRTANEWARAVPAFVLSLCRPPLLQAIGHVTVMPRRGGWLFDRLVADGRRPWLVLGSFVLGAALAWSFARRLRRLGADRAVVRLWSVAIVLLGLPALLVAWAAERPRAYAQHDVAAAPSPRLGSRAAEEVPA
ncbi:MAG TPA: hypothetical protein VF384_07875 [Planctomycetota bacterium]